MEEQRSRKLPENSIPFVLAASGHRDLVPGDLPQLRREAGELIARMAARMTSTPLLLLTGLAEGADQLIAEVALNYGAYLAVVLPLPVGLYRTLMAEEARSNFDCLLARASLTIHLPLSSSEKELAESEAKQAMQYGALADFLAQHCQALIALWDGLYSARHGGTFEVVRSVLAGVEYKDCMEPLRGTVYQIVTPRQEHKSPIPEAFELHVMRCPSDLDRGARAVPDEYLRIQKLKAAQRQEKAEPDLETISLNADDLKKWRLKPRQRFGRWLADQNTSGGKALRACAISYGFRS